jgi:hypothetical protein
MTYAAEVLVEAIPKTELKRKVSQNSARSSAWIRSCHNTWLCPRRPEQVKANKERHQPPWLIGSSTHRRRREPSAASAVVARGKDHAVKDAPGRYGFIAVSLLRSRRGAEGAGGVRAEDNNKAMVYGFTGRSARWR